MSALDCPFCGGALAGDRKYGESALRCPRCRGTWFAAGLLERCLKRLAADPSLEPPPVELRRKVLGDAVVAPPGGKCPVCAAPFATLNYGYDSNVLLARCPDDHGVWAKEGQVESLAAFERGSRRWDAVANAYITEFKKVDEEEANLRLLTATISPAPAPALGWLTGPDVPVRGASPVIYSLVALNVVVFAALWRFLQNTPAGLFRVFGLVPMLVPSHPWVLVSHMFIHAGVLHLAGNMYFLWLFGRNVEDELGSASTLVLYLFCGVIAAIGQFLASRDPLMPLVGASGAISGLLGAYARKFPRSRILFTSREGTRSVSAKFYVGAWFFGQGMRLLYQAASMQFGGVAFAAHLAGFAAGYLMVSGPAPETERTETR